MPHYLRLSIIIVFICFQLTLKAQQPQYLSGVVKDNFNTAIVGATIYIDDLKLIALTDKNGNFSIVGIKNGKYTLRINHIAYEPYLVQVSFSKAEKQHFDFILKKKITN